jgi:hypothetical protein
MEYSRTYGGIDPAELEEVEKSEVCYRGILSAKKIILVNELGPQYEDKKLQK